MPLTESLLAFAVDCAVTGLPFGHPDCQTNTRASRVPIGRPLHSGALRHVVCFSTCTQTLLHEQRCRSLVTPQSFRRRVTVQHRDLAWLGWIVQIVRTVRIRLALCPIGNNTLWSNRLNIAIRYCVCSMLLPRYSAISQCSLVRHPFLPSAHQWGLINEVPRDECSVRAAPLALQARFDMSCSESEQRR